MKNLVFLFVISALCFVSTPSNAQVQIYGRYTIKGTVEPDINIFGTKKLSDKFSLTYFALVEQKWSECLVGVSYSPTKWCSVGLGAGIEHNPNLFRFCGSLWIGKGNASLLILGERGFGKDNYWYKVVASQKLSEQFKVGVIAWRFHGLGPVVMFTPKKSDLTFWVLPAHDFEAKVNRLIVGLDIKI